MNLLTPSSLGRKNLSNGRPPRRPTDVLIIGGGASGLFCARTAAQAGLSVIVLERTASPGRKLSISGGGKANFSNRQITPQDYLCHGDPNFCQPALATYTPAMILEEMRQWHLPVEERSHGQLFLTVPARRLTQILMADCRKLGCHIHCNNAVDGIRQKHGSFEVCSGDVRWQARSVVLACGSPAWPQAGGSGAGYRLAQSLGHELVPPRPALTPLYLAASSDGMGFAALAGISLPVRISLEAGSGLDRGWEDDLLFTHDGISGPASLKASLFWQEGMAVLLDFLPQQQVAALLDSPDAGRHTARSLLARLLPQRLVDCLLPEAVARRKLAELSRKQRTIIADAVHRCRIVPQGRGGLKKAEVCAGGVNTDAIEPATMQSRLIPGLYVIGELLDVTGLLGGYNLHWAWASAWAAARHLASAKATAIFNGSSL